MLGVLRPERMQEDRITTAAARTPGPTPTGTWIAGLCPWFSATHVARIAEGTMMAFFQKKVPNLIPIDPDNVVSNDWIILLEANTIVDFSGELRVARTT